MKNKYPIDLIGLSIEESAKTVFHHFCEFAKKVGHDPEIELSLLSPEKAKDHPMGLGEYWTLFYDAGPHDWAHYFSGDMNIYSSYPPDSRPPADKTPTFIHNDSYYLDACQSFGIVFISTGRSSLSPA